MMDKIGCKFLQSIVLVLREAIFDRHVLALGIARFFQALMERGKKVWVIVARPGVEEPNHRHGPLLRARRERPRSRAAEQVDEAAPFQWIEFRQVAAIGRLAAYRKTVTKSELVQCGISVGPPSVEGQNANCRPVA